MKELIWKDRDRYKFITRTELTYFKKVTLQITY